MPLGAQLSIVAQYLPLAWLVTHIVLVVRIVLVRTITTRERWYSVLVPPRAPVVAWHHDLRWHVILWGALVALYGACGAALMLGGLPLGAQLLIVGVVVLWAWLVTHIALIARVVSVPTLTRWERVLALFPPATAYFAWEYGKRKHLALWAGLIVLYLVCYAALTRH